MVCVFVTAVMFNCTCRGFASPKEGGGPFGDFKYFVNLEDNVALNIS